MKMTLSKPELNSKVVVTFSDKVFCRSFRISQATHFFEKDPVLTDFEKYFMLELLNTPSFLEIVDEFEYGDSERNLELEFSIF
jgi:hypothetical protein